MTKYEGSAAVVNAIDLIRTVWNEMVKQFPDASVEKRVDLYSAIMPAFIDITTTALIDEDMSEMEGGYVYEGKGGGRSRRSDLVNAEILSLRKRFRFLTRFRVSKISDFRLGLECIPSIQM